MTCRSAFALTPGQTHDSQATSELLEPLPEGCVVLGDKAYDSDDIRARIEEAGAIANIPPKANRRAPPPFDGIDATSISLAHTLTIVM